MSDKPNPRPPMWPYWLMGIGIMIELGIIIAIFRSVK